MNKKKILYEVIFALLSLLVVVLAVMDLMDKIPSAFYNKYLIIDAFILFIFAADYFYFLYKSKNKKLYFKENIFNLVAIIPFNSLFRVFRIARLLRLFKLAKLFRTFVFFKRFSDKANRFLKTNGFIYIVYFTLISILAGSVLIYIVEKDLTIHSFGDAIWWSFVTTTTVGYGDISPASGIGRIIAALLMLIGIGFIGMLTGTIATFFLSKTTKKEHNPNQVINLSELSENQFRSVAHYIDYIKKSDS